MNQRQAAKLLSLIEDQYGQGSARPHILGNGEPVVIIKRGGWFCWNFEDWAQFRKQEKLKANTERKMIRREQQFAEEVFA